jgi:glycosyltransferase involved in cell wall biosynthesis
MSRKIKVLECIRQGLIGGGESHLLVLMENLDREKFLPVVLSFTEGPMIDRLNEMGVSNYVIPTEKPFDVRVWGKVKALLLKEQIELIHVHGSRANSNVLWAARSLGIPVVYTIHGWSFHQDQRGFVRRLRIMGERYLTQRSQVNISVSESNQQTGYQFIKGFSSVVVNNGIDQSRFDPNKSFRNVRSELGIPDEKTVVLFLARFTAHKQPLALLKAFADAVKEDDQLHLLMVGDGDQKEEAIRIIREQGLEKVVTLSPFRQDVPDVLASADIFVLPSLWEGLPIALLEAMAMGKAVIGTNVDGTREVIRHNENGMLISTDGLVDNLRKELLGLGKDKMLQKRLQQQAVNTVREKFNANGMTRQIEGIYNQLMVNKLNEDGI